MIVVTSEPSTPPRPEQIIVNIKFPEDIEKTLYGVSQFDNLRSFKGNQSNNNNNSGFLEEIYKEFLKDTTI
jgi:hypothetical protein